MAWSGFGPWAPAKGPTSESSSHCKPRSVFAGQAAGELPGAWQLNGLPAGRDLHMACPSSQGTAEVGQTIG